MSVNKHDVWADLVYTLDQLERPPERKPHDIEGSAKVPKQTASPPVMGRRQWNARGNGLNVGGYDVGGTVIPGDLALSQNDVVA